MDSMDAIERVVSRQTGEKFKRIEPDHLAEVFSDFPLRLSEDYDYEWMAIAIRNAIILSFHLRKPSPGQKSNADFRNEIMKISQKAKSISDEIGNLTENLWAIASQYYITNLTKQNYYDMHDFFSTWEEQSNNFINAAVQIREMSKFAKSLHEKIPVPQKNWRQRAAKNIREVQGYLLAPIFEAAFENRVTINNFGTGDARHKRPTAFMDFYIRVTTLIYGKPDYTGLPRALKRARVEHMQKPWPLEHLVSSK